MKALFKKRQPSGRAPENPAGPHRNPADDAFEEDRIVEDALTSVPLRGQEAPDEREIRTSLVEDSVLQQNMEEPRLLTFLPPTASARLDGARRHEHAPYSLEWAFILRMIAAALLLLLGIVLRISAGWKFALYAVSLLTAGVDMFWDGFRDITKKQLLNEDILISLACILTFAAGQAPAGAAAMLFAQLGSALTLQIMEKSRHQVERQLDLRPDTVRILHGEDMIAVPAAQVRPGERMLIRAGERIPLDGYIIEGETTLDLSPLTGDPAPAAAGAGDGVLSGCRNLSGDITVKVAKDYRHSAAVRAFSLWQSAAGKQGKLEKAAYTAARCFTPALLAAALLIAFLMPLILHQPLSVWLYRALTLLPLAWAGVPALVAEQTCFAGLSRACRKGIYLKSPSVMDRLRHTENLVLDQKEILTTGEYTIEYMETAAGVSEQTVLYYAAFAECLSGHPLARAICRAQGGAIDKTQIINVREIRGRGIAVELKGGDILLAGSYDFLQTLQVENLARPCDATCVMVAKNQEYLGVIYLRDTIKSSARPAVEALKNAEIPRIVLLSPERAEEAERIAKAVGIEKYIPFCRENDQVNFVKNMRANRKEKEIVVFASGQSGSLSALRTADVGVVLGGFGSEEAEAAAGAVIAGGHPTKIAEMLTLVRHTHKLALIHTLSIWLLKLLLIVPALLGLLPLWIAVLAESTAGIAVLILSMRAYGPLRGLRPPKPEPEEE